MAGGRMIDLRGPVRVKHGMVVLRRPRFFFDDVLKHVQHQGHSNLLLYQVRRDAAHTGHPLDAGPDVELSVGVFGVGLRPELYLVPESGHEPGHRLPDKHAVQIFRGVVIRVNHHSTVPAGEGIPGQRPAAFLRNQHAAKALDRIGKNAHRLVLQFQSTHS